jgi:hypothetical protein
METNTIDYLIYKDDKQFVNILPSYDVLVVYSYDPRIKLTMIEHNKKYKIKYTKESEKVVMEFIISSLGMSKSLYTFVKSNNGETDVIHVKFFEKSAFQKWLFRSNGKVNILNYTKNINTSKLEFFIPFYRFEYINEDKLLVFDHVTFKRTPCINEECKKKQLFYQLFFPIYESFDQHPQDAKPVTITIRNKVDVERLEQIDKFLKIKIENIQFNIKVNDKINLLGEQNRIKGTFIVSSISNNTIIATNYKSYKFKELFKILDVKFTNESITNKTKVVLGVAKSRSVSALIDTGVVWFEDINKLGEVFPFQKTILARIYIKQESKYDDKSECFQRPDILNQKVCEMNGYIWDKKCSVNEDCPFYSYERDIGGCHNGFCDVPLGVQRAGYKKYIVEDVEEGPLCKGCKWDNPYCCKNDEKPEYAFPGEKNFRDGVNVELFTTNEISIQPYLEKLNLQLKQKEIKFTPEANVEWQKKYVDKIVVDRGGKDLMNNIDGFVVHSSFADPTSFFLHKNKGLAKYNGYTIVQNTLDNSKQGIIISYVALFSSQDTSYIFDNITIMKKLLPEDNLEFQSYQEILKLITKTAI